MISRFIPALAGVALAATIGSASAFDAILVAPKPLRTQPSSRAAVIAVLPPNAVINFERCARGWCEASYAGQVGFVYTPVLVSTSPVSTSSSPFGGGPFGDGPIGVLTTPLTLPFTATTAILGGGADFAGQVTGYH